MSSSREEQRRLVESVRDTLSASETGKQRAARLVGVAADPSAEGQQRIAFLRMAMSADPGIARQSALVLAADPSRELRLAGAGVLASTPASEDDLPRLLSLVALEGDEEVLTLLRAALGSLELGNLSDGLIRLARLLDLPASARQLRPTVLLRDDVLRSQFRRWMDKVLSRASKAGGASGYVDAAARLAALMAELVVIDDRRDPDPAVSATEVDQIRNGLNGRPPLRDLLQRPTLCAAFPWFAECLELDQLRIRIAGKPPFLVTDVDTVDATRLLACVASGWVEAGNNLG
jgi:hypothetical protein